MIDYLRTLHPLVLVGIGFVAGVAVVFALARLAWVIDINDERGGPL